MSHENEFEFFNSDNFDTEIFEDEHENRLRKATKQEKLKLLEFIGGFYKWAELDDDCKMNVINNLDYRTRCNLTLCSKKDNQIVKETVLFITKGVLPQNEGIRMKPRNLAALCKSDFEQKHTENATIHRIKLQKNFVEIRTISNFVRTWKFNQKGNICTVISKSILKPEFTYSSNHTIMDGSAENEFTKIVKRVMNNGKCDVETLDIEAKWNIQNELINRFDNLKFLKLYYHTEEETRFWLRKLNTDLLLESFSLKYYYRSPPIPFDHIAYPSVINAKSFRVSNYIDISDEQFLSLKASRIVIAAKTLNFDVFHEFVRRWVDGEMTDDFCQCLVYTHKNDRKDFTKVAEGFEAVQHDYRIFAPPNAFLERFHRYGYVGNFYQINKRNDPFNSISVLVTAELFLVLRTGFPCVRDGRQDVQLIFPTNIL